LLSVPEPNPKPARLFIKRFSVLGGNVAFEDRAHPSAFRTEIKPITFDLRNFATVGKEGGTYALNGASEAGERFSWSGTLTTYPLASHGQFGSDPSQTFVLAYDGQLTMDDLEAGIKFGEHREKALELLILSACETASGDDRAALGLAGVALKSGARSALATLWYINDQASGELVVNFHRGVQSGKLSKAHALQEAQRTLAADPRYAHPAYWAPFLLIGNWL